MHLIDSDIYCILLFLAYAFLPHMFSILHTVNVVPDKGRTIPRGPIRSSYCAGFFSATGIFQRLSLAESVPQYTRTLPSCHGYSKKNKNYCCLKSLVFVCGAEKVEESIKWSWLSCDDFVSNIPIEGKVECLGLKGTGQQMLGFTGILISLK